MYWYWYPIQVFYIEKWQYKMAKVTLLAPNNEAICSHLCLYQVSMAEKPKHVVCRLGVVIVQTNATPLSLGGFSIQNMYHLWITMFPLLYLGLKGFQRVKCMSIIYFRNFKTGKGETGLISTLTSFKNLHLSLLVL